MAEVQQIQQVQEVQQVNIQCECHHRHGPLFLLRPWAWGRPCRRCERMMDRNVVVVPTSGPATAITVNGRRRESPVVVSTTTTTTQAVPGQQTQVVYPAPPTYTETVIVNQR